MIGESSPPPTFSKTVRLLLSTSSKRSSGRRSRQQQLLQQRSTGTTASDWSSLGSIFAVLLMMGLNIAAAFLVDNAVTAGQRVDAERHGRIVVSKSFLTAVKSAQETPNDGAPLVEDSRAPDSDAFASEAKAIAERSGAKPAAVEKELRDAYRNYGATVFAEDDAVAPGVSALGNSGPLPALLGSLGLFWWAIMLICQGEGLEVDLQRRRHPVWEWLLSHPVHAGAVFMAEMMAPLAANPIYWGAPLFAGFLFGFVYGPALGLLALLLIGVPVGVAAGCIGKALEIAVMLRFSPRSRGAVIGLMAWLGFVSMIGLFFCLIEMPRIIPALSRLLIPLAALPSPWLRLFLGIQKDGSSSFILGMLTCWLLATVAITCAVWFSVWGANRGLAGNFAMVSNSPSAPRHRPARFGKDPLYRKEFLWFIRDRSAIVQTILIPMSLAALQAFNLRGIVVHAQNAWNYLCGGAILFGTYFLWVLGPKSLSSEGSALWIAQTWPRGLESLLKAKAWLWSLIASGIVAVILIYTAWLFPSDIGKIALVGVGWFIFGRSMAEKAVTLVTVTSASGETQKVPRGRWIAAQLGMLTFSIGILTQQWHLAIVGIVYSYITAAAIWQNFRARLPFLDDPWSETLPPAPTLMHAMVAISILIEGVAVLIGIIVAAAGPQNFGVAIAIAYAVCALAVALGTASFLSDRGVTTQEVWTWQPKTTSNQEPQPWWRIAFRDSKFLFAGAACGALLGLVAHGYLLLVVYIPAAAEVVRKSQEQMVNTPELHICYAITAVLFAPFAEEYLFRGLLYRALDREWGGWSAILGSAAFFAIYHPPLSWLPVGLLGITNAFLFKKTGRLAPAVILHMVYNIVVLL